MKRQEANFKILEILTRYFHDNPDIRFWQGLFNLGIIDGQNYESESEETLKNMRKL